MISYFKRLSSLTYLNITQFSGALNDNIYKLLIVYFLIGIQGIDASSNILAITGAIFVIPFLLFSAASGVLADRFSKRDIIVVTKIFELIIMALGVLFFTLHSVYGSYIILFLMATQSAVFSPSKYGIIPEIVSTEKISRANGLLSMFTFLAIIFGTFLASFIIQITHRNFIVASIFCTFISIIGLMTSFSIECTPPSGSQKKMTTFFFKDLVQSLKLARQEPSLLAAIFGSSFFMFLGAFVQLNIIPFAVHSLNLTDVQGGYLFLLTALGIGSGAFLAGKISGKVVELGLVPFGALGVSLSCFCLDAFSDYFYLVTPFVVIVGIFGGIYQIPLDSFIQYASPKESRGQIIAATNILSFFGVLCASGFLYLISDILILPPDKGFTVMGFIALAVTITFTYEFFDYITRFVAMILSKIHFRTQVIGKERIPDCPSLYVCTHTAWNDTLLLLGSQRRRIKFFIQEEQPHSKWLLKLYRMLRVVSIPSIEPLENNVECLKNIKASLKKGISVCIFINSENVIEEINKLKESYYFLKIVEEKDYPIIPVSIEKGTKYSNALFFKSLFSKIKVPAVISFGAIIHGNQCLLKTSEDIVTNHYSYHRSAL